MDELKTCRDALQSVQRFREDFEVNNLRKLTADETRTLDVAERLLNERLSHAGKPQ